jgi:hypothetical protein
MNYDVKIDQETMAKLAKALAFICGADNAATVAMKAAAASGSAQDAKKARALFVKLKSSDRAAALAMTKD